MNEAVVGVLGLAVGLPPLVALCVHYYDVAQSYTNSNKELAAFCPILGWEHQRFSDWKAQAMSPVGNTFDDDDAAVENLTIACLQQIAAAFDNAQTLAEAYGAPKLFDLSTPHTNAPERAATLRRIAWALKGARDVEALCIRLKRYNDMLDAIWKRSRAAVARRVLPELDGLNNADGLRLIEVALNRQEDAEYRELASSVRLRRLCLEVKLAEEARFASASVAQQSFHRLDLSHSDFPPDFSRDQPHPTRTVIRGKNVMLEWKEFPRSPPPSSAMTQYEYDKIVDTNVRGLAYVLAERSKPWRLKALSCMGYYQSPTDEALTRVCFAFELPITNGDPLSLQDLMEGRQSYREGRFHLGDQFTLAQGLASSVCQLLFAGWLHKGIRSSSIYFFPPSLAGAVTASWRADPKEFSLMGYQLARLTNTAATSVKPPSSGSDDKALERWGYMHPLYGQSNDSDNNTNNNIYQPHHDIYSLGIALIEIA
jgi:hypothetical protein